jgi:hypothetical protein
MSEFQERIGYALVRTKAITQEQCNEVLQKQKEGDKRLFGEIAVSMGYIEFTALIEFLNKKRS